MKFEEAEAELEEIIKKLEKGSLSMEEAKKAFERGLELSKFCYNQTKTASGKLTVIKEELEKLLEENCNE